MADSIHDQWPVATDEWATVCAQFNAAWITINSSYDVNDYYAAFSAGIGYLARAHEDTTVMAGDMITHAMQTGTDNTRGLIQNFQNLQRHVLPQWGVVAANYAEDRAVLRQHQAVAQEKADVAAEALARGIADGHEAATRLAADQAEFAGRTTGDLNSRAQAAALVAAEALARTTGDQNSREQAAAGDKAVADALTAQVQAVLKYAQSLPGLIDSRAAAGYDPTLADRANLLTKLLDTAVAHEPLIAGLVSDLVKTIIDLAGLEDPILRIAAQLILKQVVDKLGIDTALGAMINDLIGGILGGGPPKTLQTIMGDIGNRLDALENGQAELAPLAPEADQLREMGTLIFDAVLLAYFAAAVVDPVDTANGTADAIAVIVDPLLAPIRAMLGM